MTVDLDALEAVRAKANALPFGDAWKQMYGVACSTLWNAAPALIAEHRAALARVEKLEEALNGVMPVLDGFPMFGVDAQQRVEKARAALGPKP